jgi:hypothetical protein
MTLSSQPIPVADLLTRAAHEIGLCRAMVSTVEHAVEHLHDQGSYPDLQGLDLLDQMLGDIAALLRAIAETNAFAPAVIEDAEPLLASLRLGAVRARLRNVHTDASHLRREHHVEIF